MIFERGHFAGSIMQKSFSAESLNESLNTSLNQARAFDANTAFSVLPTVFLSHKHKDLKYLTDIQGVIDELRKYGAKVYIDSIDNKMPRQTSGETALRIKEIIKYCNKFVLLATDSAIESYWCNWELGIGDTYKYIDHIAIIPMKEQWTSDNSYKGNEYLQIYPSIDLENGGNRYQDGNLIPKGYYVRKPNSRIITPLSDWLKRK